MSLRLQAERDLALTLENDADFGWPITLTSPAGTTRTVYGSQADIGYLIDPDTGQAVSGRFAHVTVRLSSVYAAFPGEGIPRGVEDESGDPWVVEYSDVATNADDVEAGEEDAEAGEPEAESGGQLSYKFKVMSSLPDRAIGLVVLRLECYE